MKKLRGFKAHTQKEEKKSRAGLYLALFLSVVMLGSIGGVFLSNPTSSADYTYGKYSFTSTENLWSTKIDGKRVLFYTLPDQAASYDVSPIAMQSIKNSAGFVISFNPIQNTTQQLQIIDVLRFELADTLVDTYPEKQVYYAVTAHSDQYPLPIVTCQNSSISFPVLVVDFGNETAIKYVNDCITITAIDEFSMIALADRIRYSLYGIIDD
ncbi:MAG TPA: hypothetical protein VKE88_00895 [Candidatus Nanoarchaeia archaeon]|nr:hypothetical protein [Candidatus Nanoarchaeia archaeon]